MALRKLAKDEDSGKHGCPTVYADDDARADGLGPVLVLQGDVVQVEPSSVARPVVGDLRARCVWTDNETVFVLGDGLDMARESGLENVLPGEGAVRLLASDLFDETRVGQPTDLGTPSKGQVLLKIKAKTVRAARERHHQETTS